MIVEQTIGSTSSSDAIYSGFGAFALMSFLSGTGTGPVSTGSNQNNKQFIGDIQTLGVSDTSVIFDASMGIT